MALAVTSELSRKARPVGWSLTATNAQDHATSERGGPSPYRAVEPWLFILLLLLLLLLLLSYVFIENLSMFYA
jgi:hypothetical protein